MDLSLLRVRFFSLSFTGAASLDFLFIHIYYLHAWESRRLAVQYIREYNKMYKARGTLYGLRQRINRTVINIWPQSFLISSAGKKEVTA